MCIAAIGIGYKNFHLCGGNQVFGEQSFRVCLVLTLGAEPDVSHRDPPPLVDEERSGNRPETACAVPSVQLLSTTTTSSTVRGMRPITFRTPSSSL